MAEQVVSIEVMARPLIEQCRREIAAAWVQIEAARDVLSHGNWLLVRWAEGSRLYESSRADAPERSEAARIGMFVSVEPEPHRGRRNRGAGRGRTLRTLRKRRSRDGLAMTNLPTQL
jgi:hypothetical protein